MHPPTVCASCTMHNVTKLLRNVTEAIRECHGTLQKHSESSRDVTKRYGTFRNVTENIDFANHLLTSRFWSSLRCWRACCTLHILSVQKYCQLSTHEPNTFLLNNAPFKLTGEKLPEASRIPPFLPQYVDPRLIHPSLDRPNSPSQTASGSNQSFCHNTLSEQTDRHTHTHTHTDRQMG